MITETVAIAYLFYFGKEQQITDHCDEPVVIVSRKHTGGVSQLPLTRQVTVADPESVYPLSQL